MRSDFEGLAPIGEAGSCLRQVCTALLIATVVPAAHTQTRPLTEIESRAFYCMPILQEDLRSQQNVAKASPDGDWKRIQKAEADRLAGTLGRLQAYVGPNLQSLDIAGIDAAMDRGHVDRADSTKAMAVCMKQCSFDPAKQARVLARAWTQARSFSERRLVTNSIGCRSRETLIY